MNEKKRTPGKRIGCVVAQLVVFTVFVLPLAGFRVIAARHYRQLRRADHPQVLAVCRTMIADARAHVGEGNLPESRFKNLADPVAKPQDIPGLTPSYLVFTKDYVMMCFSALPRVYLLAFSEGVEQCGNEKLIDGLWISSGSPHNYTVQQNPGECLLRVNGKSEKS
jgi:hypothetical protein